MSLHERYGDIVRIGLNFVSIRDPSFITPLLGPSGIGKAEVWNGAFLSQTNISMVGIQDTEEHMRRRRAWNRGLGLGALKDYEHLIAARVRQLVHHLEKLCDEVVLGKWFDHFSYDFMCDMAFGGGLELMQEGDTNSIWAMLEKGVRFSMFFSYIPWLAVYIGHIPAAVRPLHAFFEHGRDAVMKRMTRGSATPDLFHYLNNEDAPDKGPPLLRYLIDDGILAIVAGSDMVAGALTSLFFCILTHPEAYAALQAEVDVFYPQGEEARGTGHHRDMRYLNAVINETLRLFPPLGSPRQVPFGSSGITIQSTYLPAETWVYVAPYVFHRDAWNFSHPNAFWPERWFVAAGRLCLEDAKLSRPRRTYTRRAESEVEPDIKLEHFVHNDGAFIPFSYGPMNCPGKGLALPCRKFGRLCAH